MESSIESANAPPRLWSFRRCPFAIRARLALAAAGVTVDLREVNLRAKPPELLAVSPKATVPVLELGSGRVLEESLAIMGWALQQHDPGDWLRQRRPAAEATAMQRRMAALIRANDGPFRDRLNRVRYSETRPARKGREGRGGSQSSKGSQSSEGSQAGRQRAWEQAVMILRGWNRLLQGPDRWLLGREPSLADMALLPFVRQLRLADPNAFSAVTGLEPVRQWLARYEASEWLAQAMAPPLAERTPWRSPQWIYHLALREEWRQTKAEAEREGTYRRSTRGLSLEQVGFIHASAAHQINATANRFYRDAGPITLLSIDPQRLQAAGIPLVWERDPHLNEDFPHIQGPLPLAAVVAAEPFDGAWDE